MIAFSFVLLSFLIWPAFINSATCSQSHTDISKLLDGMCCNIINQWLIPVLISFLGSHLFPGTKLMAYFKPKLSLHTHLYISTTVPMTMEKIYKLEHCICCKVIITRASVNGKPESENATVFLAKRGVMVPGVSCVDCGNWG